VFLHFLERRIALTSRGHAHAQDEIDWLGHYLHEGLDLDSYSFSDSTQEVGLLTFTADIDDYYLHELGYRQTPTKKPSVFLPPHMAACLDWLEEARPAGYTNMSCLLLDMSDRDRTLFEEQMRKVLSLAGRGNRLPHFTMRWANGAAAIMVMVASHADEPQLERNLETLAWSEHGDGQPTKWLLAAYLEGADQPLTRIWFRPSAAPS
jgi:hypothetical protein